MLLFVLTLWHLVAHRLEGFVESGCSLLDEVVRTTSVVHIVDNHVSIVDSLAQFGGLVANALLPE